MERLFATLKTECFRNRIPKYRAQAQAILFDYRNLYNAKRFHSALGYVSPGHPVHRTNILASSKSSAYASYAMTPREAEEIRIQIAEAVQRRDELYGRLKVSIEDLNEVEHLERELLKAQQDVVAAFDKRRAG